VVDEAVLCTMKRFAGVPAKYEVALTRHEAKPSTFAKATADKCGFIDHFCLFWKKGKKNGRGGAACPEQSLNLKNFRITANCRVRG